MHVYWRGRHLPQFHGVKKRWGQFWGDWAVSARVTRKEASEEESAGAGLGPNAPASTRQVRCGGHRSSCPPPSRGAPRGLRGRGSAAGLHASRCTRGPGAPLSPAIGASASTAGVPPRACPPAAPSLSGLGGNATCRTGRSWDRTLHELQQLQCPHWGVFLRPRPVPSWLGEHSVCSNPPGS